MKKLVLIALFGAFMNDSFAQSTALVSQTDIGGNWYSESNKTGGQSFTVEAESLVTELRFYVLPAADEGVTQVELRAGEDTTGTLLYTTSIDITTNGWISVSIPSVALCPGVYCFTLSNFNYGAVNVANPYAGGKCLYTGYWESGFDMAFEIIGEANTTAPVPDIAMLPDVVTECTIYGLDAPTATDNCAETVTVTNNVLFPIEEEDTVIVTWTYDDGNGGITTQTQRVIVLADTTAPTPDAEVLADIVPVCLVTTLEAPSALDCRGEVTVTHDATLPIETIGTTVVTWTYTDPSGNASTQTQHVIILPFEATVVASSAVLTATTVVTLNADYQWLNCDNGYSIIAGATEPSFTIPGISGNYAVKVSENGCVDTSACIVVDLTGLTAITAENVLIYPNPTNGIVHIEAADLNPSGLSVIDLQGRTVLQQATLSFPLEINTANWENGIYVLQLHRDGQLIGTQRIIKE
jgi:hypothetical protein